MEHARLGRTGLDVSITCLGSGGASGLGQKTGLSFDESVKVVHAAMDNGVNFIDTATGYGTEEIVGAAIKGRRDELVISTKSPVVSDPMGRGDDFLTGDGFAERVDLSLDRLGTDYIDIFHVHGLKPRHYDYCVSEIVPAMERLRDQGKIRFLAVSEGWASDPRHVMLDRAIADDHFDVMMVGLNIVNESALQRILPVAKTKDIGVQAMYAVRGKLASPESAMQVVNQAVEAGEVDAADIDPSNPLGFLVEPGVATSLAEACYRFDRHAPGVDSVLTGTGNIGHLIENIGSISGPPLPPGVLSRLDHIFGRVESVIGD
jgi:L-galactose dehydrogenase